jgi:hypothetical protein
MGCRCSITVKITALAQLALMLAVTGSSALYLSINQAMQIACLMERWMNGSHTPARPAGRGAACRRMRDGSQKLRYMPTRAAVGMGAIAKPVNARQVSIHQ